MSINKDTVHELVGVFYQPPIKTFYINSIDGESFVTPQGVFVSLGITTSMSVLESIRNVLEKSSGFTARLCMIKSRKVAGQFLNIVMPVKESDIKQFNMEVFPPGCMNKQESEDELSRLMSEIPENEEQKDVDGIYCGLQELCESMGKCNWINEHIYGMDKNIRSLGNTVAIFIHGLYHIVMKFLKDTPLSEKIKTPEHKSFIKEYEEFNKEHDFPEPQILVDFDQLAKFINLSIRTEFIPEVSFYKSGRNYVNDGKKFEKILFDNLQKSEVLLVEMEEEKYVFKRIK